MESNTLDIAMYVVACLGLATSIFAIFSRDSMGPPGPEGLPGPPGPAGPEGAFDRMAESLGGRMDEQRLLIDADASNIELACNRMEAMDTKIKELDNTLTSYAMVIRDMMPPGVRIHIDTCRTLRQSYLEGSYREDGEDIVKIKYDEWEDLLRSVGAIDKDEAFPPATPDTEDHGA